MFVSGAFVLTDTLGRSFDSLFAGVYADTDVQVTAKPKVGDERADGRAGHGDIPAADRRQVRAVPGVGQRPPARSIADGARVIGKNGKVVTTFGPPRFGGNWTGETDLLRAARGPRRRAPTTRSSINADLAKAGGLKVGDQVGVLHRSSRRRPSRWSASSATAAAGTPSAARQTVAVHHAGRAAS